MNEAGTAARGAAMSTGRLSPLLYAAGVALSFRSPRLAQVLYILVALLWFIPDRRIENTLRPPDACEAGDAGHAV